MARRLPLRDVISAVLAAALVALFLLPLIALGREVGWSTLFAVASDPGFRSALDFTLLASAFSLLVVLVLGVPFGYVLARREFPGKSVVEAVVTLPILIPHLVVGLALVFLVAPATPVGALLKAAGIPVANSLWGVVAVMVYVSASYTVLSSEIAFRSVDAETVEVARSLGASPADAFADVTLPLAARGILSGALLSWARSVSEIGGFLTLAFTVYPSGPYNGPVTNPVSVYVYSLYELGNIPGAAAAATILLMIGLVVFVAVRLASRTGLLSWSAAGVPR
jgi:molybdate/tungstate transport system permease protein